MCSSDLHFTPTSASWLNMVERFFQIAKYAPAQLIVGEISEETLHHIEPGGAGGSEMHLKTGMALEPALHLGVLVSGVVIADQM